MAAAIFSTVKSKKVGKTIIIRQLITKKKRKEVRITSYHPPMDQNFSLKMPA
jgi:molybdopterin-guanine dinucleotide biosynthesis protein